MVFISQKEECVHRSCETLEQMSHHSRDHALVENRVPQDAIVALKRTIDAGLRVCLFGLLLLKSSCSW
jgi:hypothetical protein